MANSSPKNAALCFREPLAAFDSAAEGPQGTPDDPVALELGVPAADG